MCGTIGPNGGTPSATDSASQSWSTAAAPVLETNGGALAIFYFPNSAAITTATFKSSTGNTISCCFFEIAGAATTSPLDVKASYASTSLVTSVTTSTAATNAANDVAIGTIGVIHLGGTPSSVTSGWTPEGTINGSGYSANSSYYYGSSGTLTAMTANTALTLAATITSAYAGVVIATFKAAAAAPSYVPPSLHPSFVPQIRSSFYHHKPWKQRNSGLLTRDDGLLRAA